MTVRTILITSFLILITFELVNSTSTNKTKLSKKSKRFMQNGGEEEEEQQPVSTSLPTTIIQIETQASEINPPIIEDNPLIKYGEYQICKELLKPSTAFTVILMIYMVLIIAGGVLVLVLLKKIYPSSYFLKDDLIN